MSVKRSMVHEGELWYLDSTVDELGTLVFDPYTKATAGPQFASGNELAVILLSALVSDEDAQDNALDPDLHIGRVRITAELLESEDQLTMDEGKEGPR